MKRPVLRVSLCGLLLTLTAILLLACSGILNPAGKKLDEAQALALAGSHTEAIAVYEEVVYGWPDSEEAGNAGKQIAQLHVLAIQEKLDTGSYLLAATLIRELQSSEHAETASPELAMIMATSSEVATALRWMESEAMPLPERAALSMQLLEEAPFMESNLKEWMSENFPVLYQESCTNKARAIDSISDLDELSQLEADCTKLANYSPSTPAGQRARIAVDETIPSRKSAIMSSRSYRSAALLDKCRTLQAVIKREKQKVMRAQASGDYARAQRQLDASMGVVQQQEYRLNNDIGPEIRSMQAEMQRTGVGQGEMMRWMQQVQTACSPQ